MAVKAVWRCEGRRTESARCQRGGFGIETMRDGLILQTRWSASSAVESSQLPPIGEELNEQPFARFLPL